MMDHPGWYPPGQVCYPPELPSYLKNVHDLKPIVGVPSGDELVGIHSVIQAAVRVSSVPGMHDPSLFTQLGDHLFSAQMAVYRSKYTSLLFPSDAMYTPPTLPAHVLARLEPISCAPTDEQVSKVHEAIRSYQKFSEIPSMFEPRVHADLSQHLFDIQMARYMIQESKRKPNMTQAPGPARTFDRAIDTTEESVAHDASNNVGARPESPQISAIEVRDILERSNAIAERANELSERSNQLIERSNQLAEQSNRPVEKPDQSKDVVALRFNELLTRLVRFFDQSNQLAKEAKKPMEELVDIFRTINKVLVRIQHSIIRSDRGNTRGAVKCLINEKGDLPTDIVWGDVPTENSWGDWPAQPGFGFHRDNDTGTKTVKDNDTGTKTVKTKIRGQIIAFGLSEYDFAQVLRFYGIEGSLFEGNKRPSKQEWEEARRRLKEYWTSALGT
ncbi:hypothetical protein RHS03_01224, partial [Rhizoctonia solani]